MRSWVQVMSVNRRQITTARFTSVKRNLPHRPFPRSISPSVSASASASGIITHNTMMRTVAEGRHASRMRIAADRLQRSNIDAASCRVHTQLHGRLSNAVRCTSALRLPLFQFARFCQHNCAKVDGRQCVPGPPSSFDNTAWTYIKLFHFNFFLNACFLNFGFSIFTRAPL